MKQDRDDPLEQQAEFHPIGSRCEQGSGLGLPVQKYVQDPQVDIQVGIPVIG